MKLRLQIAIPCLVAVVASLAMDPSHWDSIRDGAMIVLSVLVAAVLFRLGRGIPPVIIDYLRVDEARDLAKAFNTIALRLSIVAAVTTGAFFGLAMIGFLHELVDQYLPEDIGDVCAKVLTAALAWIMAFAFCRAVMVVRGDLSFIAVQSENMVKCVQRRHARDEIVALDEAEKIQPFKASPNYGKFIERH